MKRNTLLKLVAMLALLATGCQPAQQTSNSAATSNEPEVATTNEETQKIVLAARDDLFKQLSTRLIEAMSSGGSAAAIEVCRREAPKIAAAVGEQHGVAIGRTSLKLRNPKNAPPEWARTLVEKKTEDTQFVELPDGGIGALLPIKLKTQCLACHGPIDQIAEDIKTKLTELYPDDQATGFKDGDLRGWFWVVVPAESEANAPVPEGASLTEDREEHVSHGPGRGMGRGRGMMGRGLGSGMRGDMTTIHAMFDNRDKIKRTVKDLPNGAEAITESDDEEIVALIQQHVPAMESRIVGNEPLPPMTFYPVFVELIKHADDYTLNYEDTDNGVKVTYHSDDPFVVMLVQEHAQLVSRFIKNGMEEIHKPYTLPEKVRAWKESVFRSPPASAEIMNRNSPSATTASTKSKQDESSRSFHDRTRKKSIPVRESPGDLQSHRRTSWWPNLVYT